MKPFYAIMAALIFSLTALPALATTVTNLSAASQEFDIINGGEVRHVVLKPGETVYSYGPRVILRKQGQPEVRSDRDEAYSIWNNGRITIQHYRRHLRTGGHGGR